MNQTKSYAKSGASWVLIVGLLLGLAACKEEGAEGVGERIDEAIEETEDVITNDGPMENAGEAIDEKSEEVKEVFED